MTGSFAGEHEGKSSPPQKKKKERKEKKSGLKGGWPLYQGNLSLWVILHLHKEVVQVNSEDTTLKIVRLQVQTQLRQQPPPPPPNLISLRAPPNLIRLRVVS